MTKKLSYYYGVIHAHLSVFLFAWLQGEMNQKIQNKKILGAVQKAKISFMSWIYTERK